MDAILLGRDPEADDLVTFSADSHLLTIAPNRSNRGRACLIANLLAYPGQLVVIDLNGSAYAATAEARRRMGHTVVRLDPFGVAGPGTDALDPIDLLAGLEEPALTSACQDLADLIHVRGSLANVAAYEAYGLLTGLIGYLYAIPEKRAFNELSNTLRSEDVVYSLAVVLDTAGKLIPKMSYFEIASFLQMDDRPRSNVLGMLRSHVTTLGNPEVQRSLGASTVPLSGLVPGTPVTIYIVIPAERLSLHSALLRIWVGILLHNALRSVAQPELPTLFLLDHCAEIGSFPLLESLLTVGSPGSYRIWTFWHDVHQLRTAYPAGWPAIVSGCGAVQVFGTKDSAAAAEAEALLRLPANDVWSLGSGEQIVRCDGAPRKLRKLDP